MTILLVETIQALADRARDMLHTDGFDTQLAVNGREAVSLITSPGFHCDVAVVNVGALLLDEANFFGHYFHNPATQRKPIILAAEDANDPRLARFAGMIGAEYALSLPYQREELRAMFQQFFPNLKNYLRAAASVMNDFQLTLRGFQELLSDFIRLVQGDIERLTRDPRSEVATIVMNNLMDGIVMMGTQQLRDLVARLRATPVPAALSVLDLLKQLLGCLLEAKAHYEQRPPQELAPLVNSMTETTRLLMEVQGKTDGNNKKFLKFMAAAQAGSTPDMVRVGMSLHRGCGCQANPAEGNAWLQKAVDAKDPLAMTRMGLQCISSQDVIPQDVWQKGFAYFTEAGRLGAAEAKYWRTQMLRYGQSDDEEGLGYLILARQGDPDSQSRLGMLYDKGESFPRDGEEALYWLSQAAGQGHSEAQFRVRVLEQMPSIGELAKVDKTATPTPSAPKALPDSLLDDPAPASLAVTGQPLAQPTPAVSKSLFSVDSLTLDANGGSPEAQCLLGIAYLRGQGEVEVNVEEAYRWFQKAAHQHHPKALCRLALLTISTPAPPEPEEWQLAYSQFTEAARRGNEEALYWRSQMLAHGLSDTERGLGFIAKARNGDPNAQYRLGLIYDGGSKIPKDVEEARYWFSAAASSGHADARARLIELGAAQTPQF